MIIILLPFDYKLKFHQLDYLTYHYPINHDIIPNYFINYSLGDFLD